MFMILLYALYSTRVKLYIIKVCGFKTIASVVRRWRLGGGNSIKFLPVISFYTLLLWRWKSLRYCHHPLKTKWPFEKKKEKARKENRMYISGLIIKRNISRTVNGARAKENASSETIFWVVGRGQNEIKYKHYGREDKQDPLRIFGLFTVIDSIAIVGILNNSLYLMLIVMMWNSKLFYTPKTLNEMFIMIQHKNKNIIIYVQ